MARDGNGQKDETSGSRVAAAGEVWAQQPSNRTRSVNLDDRQLVGCG
jgi:hypothetical protein